MTDNLPQLRARQTELVQALSVETSTLRLQELSSELETLLQRMRAEESGGPAGPAGPPTDADTAGKDSAMGHVNEGKDSPGEQYPPASADPVDQRESLHWGNAGNIREKQQTHAGGAVPPAYIGSGDPAADPKPEDAADNSGMWDGQGQGADGQ